MEKRKNHALVPSIQRQSVYNNIYALLDEKITKSSMILVNIALRHEP